MRQARAVTLSRHVDQSALSPVPDCAVPDQSLFTSAESLRKEMPLSKGPRDSSCTISKE